MSDIYSLWNESEEKSKSRGFKKLKIKHMKRQIQNNEPQASNLENAIICTIVILICLFGDQLLDKLFF